MANRLMRKVRRAVRGRENSEEAAPMPAAALSAERAKPRERASAGERISTSSQLASLMVFSGNCRKFLLWPIRTVWQRTGRK